MCIIIVVAVGLSFDTHLGSPDVIMKQCMLTYSGCLDGASDVLGSGSRQVKVNFRNCQSDTCSAVAAYV